MQVFCNASENGYRCVAYAWRRPANKSIYGVLLFNEYRVAPKNPATIPMFEFGGGH